MTFELFGGELSASSAAMLALAMTVALGFEFVNGFHDTANAVATVIYTRSLPPRLAVALSGVCNFLGVYLGGTAVAFAVVGLLPVDLLVSGDEGSSLAMIFALLASATAWNLGTWLLGLPASSSHTLVGAILGVGLAHAAIVGKPLGAGVNWSAAWAVGVSLLISPLVGFVSAAALYRAIRIWFRDKPGLFEPAKEHEAPPAAVRATLIATCTGVSLAHGSNDGQKGIGLVMLILIGLLPARYALNPTHKAGEVARVILADERLQALLEKDDPGPDREGLRASLEAIRREVEGKARLRDVPADRHWGLRARLLRVDRSLQRVERATPSALAGGDRERLRKAREALAGATNYAPWWVPALVASALGLGTMVGWKRIVVTVGEKIGKSHLSYAQGAAAEIVAVATIGLADFGGLPVSTTHVLSSGVAGTMAASGSGLQLKTVRNIALAWVLTLPAAMTLAAGLYAAFRPLLAGFGRTVHP